MDKPISDLSELAAKSKHKLVIVDDEAEILRSLTRLLRQDYEPVPFSSGESALNYLQSNAASIIISDMRMPGMDGAEFLSQAKKLHPNAIRILLTGHSDLSSAIRAINEAGVHTYLSKPWDNQALKLAISKDIELYEMRDREQELTRALLEKNLELEKLNKRLEDKNKELALLSATDSLTKLANRRTFDQTLDSELRRAKRNLSSLALLIIDVDHFKLYNDNYGHLAGDDCLKNIAKVFYDFAQRSTDLAARYGGEEFAIILGNSSVESASLYAETIRKSIEELKLPHTNNLSGYVTVSIGVGVVAPDLFFEPEELINMADEALYSAKNKGRNKVELISYSV